MSYRPVHHGQPDRGIPDGVEAPSLTEALAAQPAGAKRADRAFDPGLDTMLGLMLRRRAPG